MQVPFVDPESHDLLREEDGFWVNERTGEKIAPIIDGIPRFVSRDENYAESFGWQWKKWENTRSGNRGSRLGLHETLLHRTHFMDFNMEGRLVLECGMGGGDDTEILLTLPFSEVHSFDLSTSVERAAKHIKDNRVVISQASIFRIPYPDKSFDVVFCHRVLQHTPDPVAALRAVCAKVKPGGILFAHAYKRSWRYMLEWRYKYRWLTKRLPRRWIYWYAQKFGPVLHRVNRMMWRHRLSGYISYSFMPFYCVHGMDMSDSEMLELEKLITFDALTPFYDRPMSSREFFGTIESEGFEIRNRHDPRTSPMWCTAIAKET